MGKGAIHQLMRSLYQSIGNKRYLHDLEIFLSKLELSPEEAQTLCYLSRDIENLKSDRDRAKRNEFLPPFCR